MKGGKRIKRLEENGIIEDNLAHWELIENRAIYVYPRHGSASHVIIPIDIIRHLNLKNKDKIDIAIRRSEK